MPPWARESDSCLVTKVASWQKSKKEQLRLDKLQMTVSGGQFCTEENLMLCDARDKF